MYDQLLQSASKQYGLSFHDYDILHRTSRTLVLSLKSDQEDYVLKCIFVDENRLHFMLDAEHYLRSKGIHIPRIIPALSGHSYFLWEGDYYFLQEKLQDSQPSPPVTLEMIERRAALLGNMHIASLGFRSKHGPEIAEVKLWMETYRRKLSAIHHWKEKYYASRASKKKAILSFIDFFYESGQIAANRVQQQAYFQKLRTAPVYEHYLSHGDFHSDNVLSSGTQLYIIDWEFVCYDYPSKDIHRFLIGIMNRRKIWDPALFQHLMVHYLQHNPLNESQIQLLYLDLTFPHSFSRFLSKADYRELSMEKINAFLQREYNKTVYLQQQLKNI